MAIEGTSRGIPGPASSPGRRIFRYRRTGKAGRAHQPRGRLARIAVLAIAALWSGFIEARVLQEGDFAKIADIRTSFMNVTGDIDRSSRRPDISTEDGECMKSALRELLQIAQELSSYEYLITIESEIGEFGDDNAIKGLLQFALDNALAILDTERKRLSQLSDQCSRYPVALGKTQQAIRLVDATTAILKSLQPRL